MDVRVRLLHKRLKLDLLYNTNLVRDARHEVMLLIDELAYLKAILEEAYIKYNKDETFRKWEEEIIEAVNNIEKTIDTYVIQAKTQSQAEILFRRFSGTKKTNTAEKVRDLREDKVKPLIDKFKLAVPKFSIADAAPESSVTAVSNPRRPAGSGTQIDPYPGLQEKLKHIALHEASLTRGAEGELGLLEGELRLLGDMLEEVSRNKENVYFKIFKGKIREATYNIEETIDRCLTNSKAGRRTSNWFNKFQDLTLAKEVNILRLNMVKPLLDESKKVAYSIDNDAPPIQVPRIIQRRDRVGFEEDETELIGYLMEKNNELDVITIVGMPGLGKTTLAAMIFQNPEVEIEFPTRIWVYISQGFNTRNVFLQILCKLIPRIDDDMEQKSDQELAETVANLLNHEHFLMIIDDVWTCEDWDRLKICLPSTGKVLVTSRQLDVASHANSIRKPHFLRCLTHDEGLQLLQLQVFGQEEFPRELKPAGWRIVQECEFLPLAIVVIGGILHARFRLREDPAARKREWERFSESFVPHLTAFDESKTIETIISLSYDKLPYHLKACFLYCGVFPEDYDIPARKLTRMWVAEGFVQHEDGLSYEETAERYLDELITRSLIQCQKVGSDGKVKTCCIHVMVHAFCIAEGKKVEKSFHHAIHANILTFLSSIPPSPGVRSFVSFSREEVEVLKKYASAIPSAYKLLRVLESKPIIFPIIPSNMFQLVHLKYITLSLGRVDTLPIAFSKLYNLQTLTVHTKSRTLEVKANIWEMIHLRHFETNASATLPSIGKSSTSETQLQTLGGVSPESCTEEVLSNSKVRYVKNLSIHGELALILGSKNKSVNLGNMWKLEKLKLLNDASLPQLPQGQLPELPSAFRFPFTLKSLTLSRTFFVWEHISILGMLMHLRVLKLKENAFVGEIWNSVNGEFKNLEALQIERIDFATWTMSSDSFPRLRQLELKVCEKLEMVPIELADIPTFQVLNLYCCRSAASSAKKIKERKEAIQRAANQYGNKFKLSLFPPCDT